MSATIVPFSARPSQLVVKPHLIGSKDLTPYAARTAEIRRTAEKGKVCWRMMLKLKSLYDVRPAAVTVIERLIDDMLAEHPTSA